MLILSGAGMGVDSGLPDFRGRHGFWKAYPPIAKLGLDFSDMAQPRWFDQDPTLAWGFYGHRLGLYRRTVPHAGYKTLLRWATEDSKLNIKSRYFSFTSNVDGHFLKAGFDPRRVCEVHGSINYLQCSKACDDCPGPSSKHQVHVDASSVEHHDISDGELHNAQEWFQRHGSSTVKTASFEEPLNVNMSTLRIPKKDVPKCTYCDATMRPNIFLFDDDGFYSRRQQRQLQDYSRFLEGRVGPMVVLEFGAGTAVPTIRMQAERLARRNDVVIIRVNPQTSGEDHWQSANDDDDAVIHLRMGALEAISAIDTQLKV